MKRTLALAVLSLLLLTACSLGKPADSDGQAQLPSPPKDLCVPCGTGCIPKELQAFTQCLRQTEEFTCTFQDNACTRVD